MREIKFRAWNVAKKGFVYFECEYTDKQYKFDWEKAQQFTCLRDKNGREIYEGDILRCSVKAIGDRVVGWQGTEWCLFKNGHPMCMHSSFWEKSEVIGNIHENPYLLEES